jgi:hypothetical protein
MTLSESHLRSSVLFVVEGAPDFDHEGHEKHEELISQKKG